MKEAYVSYEISLLLDEKGFEEETTWYYNSKGFCEPFSAWVYCPCCKSAIDVEYWKDYE